MMYQAGRDAGCEWGGPVCRTEDVNEALTLALAEGDEAWQFEEWQEAGQEGLWIERGDLRCKWIIFRRCPLMLLARKTGSNPGGILCQALHGYIAGCTGGILGRQTDLRLGHSGTRACKVLLELRY
jgi:hypothetical protein